MGTTVKIGTLDGQYIETPAQSGYYTFPADVHLESPAGSGLYTVGPLNESATGLYDIPALTFSSLEYLRGGPSNIVNWTVQEDATTIDPSNYNGGAGQVTVEALEGANSLLSLNKELFLEDSSAGTIQTTVRDVQTSDGTLTITADSPLGLFNSYHVVQPHIGTLRTAFAYYLGVVGITSNLSVTASIANRAVTYPGWVGNVWDNVKQILSAEQIEIASVLGTIMVRPIRSREATLSRATSLGRSINKQSVSEQIEVHWYNNQQIIRGEVYPIPGTPLEDISPATVESGRETKFTVEMNASLSSVQQPVAIDFVENRPYPNTDGVYSVVADDGLPVPAAQWTANGGRLSVRITEDPSVLEVTVVGMRASGVVKGPFRIAMSSGNFYNSLHITGSGVAWNDQKTVLYTGATHAVTGEQIGTTVENRFIRTYAQALNAGQITSKAYARNHEASGNVVSFDSQIFGDTPGARIRTPDANYRVDSITATRTGTSFTASEDTTMEDFSAVWEGLPAEAFANYWSGKTALEFSTTPLRSS